MDNKSEKSIFWRSFVTSGLWALGGIFVLFYLVLFRLNQPRPPKGSEASVYVWAMNNGQSANYRDYGKFLSDLEALEVIPAETDKFRYRTLVLNGMAVQNNGVLKESALRMATMFPKFIKENSRLSYTGLVWIAEKNSGENITQTVLCRSITLTSEEPPAFDLPKLPIKAHETIACPAGYEETD